MSDNVRPFERKPGGPQLVQLNINEVVTALEQQVRALVGDYTDARIVELMGQIDTNFALVHDNTVALRHLVAELQERVAKLEQGATHE